MESEFNTENQTRSENVQSFIEFAQKQMIKDDQIMALLNKLSEFTAYHFQVAENRFATVDEQINKLFVECELLKVENARLKLLVTEGKIAPLPTSQGSSLSDNPYFENLPCNTADRDRFLFTKDFMLFLKIKADLRTIETQSENKMGVISSLISHCKEFVANTEILKKQ